MHFGSVVMAPPPRRVPPSLTVANVFNLVAQIGWFVFGFGMIFVWVFMSNADFSFVTFRGPHAEQSGRVTGVENTNASESETSIMANHYEFSVAGQRFNGTSYSLGSSASEGERVTIEYDEDDPTRSRISGMRRAMFSPVVSLVSIFALIGLIIVLVGTRIGLKRNHLLRNGMLAKGTLINRTRTNVTVNDSPVWEVTFEFTTRDGRRAEAKARATDTERLEDESEEALLYDPNDPSRAYVLDEAPARPEFEMNGELRGRGLRALPYLIVPSIVIAANVLMVMMKLR